MERNKMTTIIELNASMFPDKKFGADQWNKQKAVTPNWDWKVGDFVRHCGADKKNDVYSTLAHLFPKADKVTGASDTASKTSSKAVDSPVTVMVDVSKVTFTCPSGKLVVDYGDNFKVTNISGDLGDTAIMGIMVGVVKHGLVVSIGRYNEVGLDGSKVKHVWTSKFNDVHIFTSNSSNELDAKNDIAKKLLLAMVDSKTTELDAIAMLKLVRDNKLMKVVYTGNSALYKKVK
jgi:hypothetical protein